MTSNFGCTSAKLVYVTFVHELEDRYVDFRKLYGNDPSITGKNLANFRQITPGVYET